jgi:cytochrome c553
MFRSGERKSEQMNIIAKALSDEDIENLAAYFEGLHPGGS